MTKIGNRPVPPAPALRLPRLLTLTIFLICAIPGLCEPGDAGQRVRVKDVAAIEGIGGTVRLQPVSILHGGLTVNVVSQVEVSQPNAFSSGGVTQVVQQTQVQAEDKPVNRIDLKEGATVEDLVQELQRTGAGARDVISILQAMKEAGALEADLEVI